MQNSTSSTSTHSIRTPLIAAFALLVLLPALGIVAFTAITTYQHAIDRTTNQLDSVATLKAAQIDTLITEWLDELEAVGDNISPSLVDWVSRNPDGVSSAFHQQMTKQLSAQENETRIFQKLYILNPQGQIIGQAIDETTPPDFTAFSYFEDNLRGAGVEGVRYVPGQETIYIWFLQPIMLGDMQVGILAGRMSLFRINLLMRERAGLGETGETYLVDADQILISPSRFENYDVGTTRIETEVMANLLQTNATHSGVYPDYRAIPVVGVGRWIPRLEAGLIAEMDRDEATADVQQTIFVNVGMTGAAILVVLVVGGWAVNRFFIVPLRQLAATAAEIAEGTYNQSAVSGRRDEFGVVARAFDEMSVKIRQNIEQLAHNEARFRSITESLPLGLLLLKDMGGTLMVEGVNPAAEQLFHVKAADINDKPLTVALPMLERMGLCERFKTTLHGGQNWQEEIEDSDDAATDFACEVYAFLTIPGRMVAAFVDIRERKLAEYERQQLQQQIIESQRTALKELSTPIIPLMSGVIIMPLIGSIDTGRARDIMRAVLAGISDHRAKVVILDITGVPLVDTGVASHLNGTMQAARLKGAHVIVTGVSDAVAETVVDLGIDWSHIETLRDLESGMAAAEERLGKSAHKKRTPHNGNGGTHTKHAESRHSTPASSNGIKHHTS